MSSAGWATLQSLLPKNWAQRAEELRLCRSIRSATGEERAKLRDPGTLLRLVLHHVHTGSSLDQTVTLAADHPSLAIHSRWATCCASKLVA